MAKKGQLEVGDKIPSFSLYDQNGKLFNSDELYDAPAVLYFYPKDDTPGCTLEACSFRDSLEEFKELETFIVGISPDSIESHKMFSDKYQLNFLLLADLNHSVCEEFGVWKQKEIAGNKVMGVERTTFLVDNEGVIRWLERPVKVDGHVERLFHAIWEYTNLEPQE